MSGHHEHSPASRKRKRALQPMARKASKGDAKEAAHQPGRKANLSRSRAITDFKRSYGDDLAHHKVFEATAARVVGGNVRAIYAGCHRHVTLAAYCAHTVFVDCDARIASFYADEAIADWVASRNPGATFAFLEASFDAPMQGIADFSFDLLVSLSAGLASGHCARYVRPGGLLLVNDSHADARNAYVNYPHHWRLVAVWSTAEGSWVDDSKVLEKCFQVRPKTAEGRKSVPTCMTPDQVNESVTQGVVAKRSFLTLVEYHFYLFEKR
eukprot:NODE_3269_length_1011_cov_29.930353_g3007_i0.p1 GENE.NODE_3269_length_1011_cov_29.930353_g3007_i0~~NODE_3269_length_1011_cov_29.930353_g3007_i0.p1  ORF type:complete len:301 (-),score=46.39 NODE_3269_length_1011_cov_29.930353_g3007_i0:107-910(-)